MSYFAALTELFHNQMQRIQRAGTETGFELGVIKSDLSLSVDSLKDPVPKEEYLLSLHLTGLTGNELHSIAIAHQHAGGGHVQAVGDGVHTHADGTHHHVLPEPLRGIRPGDRVLVVWAGNQPVVLDIVVSSREVTLDGR